MVGKLWKEKEQPVTARIDQASILKGKEQGATRYGAWWGVYEALYGSRVISM